MTFDARIEKTGSNVFVVRHNDKLIKTHLSGKLRLDGLTPVINDFVQVKCLDEHCNIQQICKRKNFLKRPRCANIDQGIIVSSVREPDINFRKIYKIILLLEMQNIKPIIVLTKLDLLKNDQHINSFIKNLEIDNYSYSTVKFKNEYKVDFFKNIIKNKTSIIMGESGVGKSTLINNLAGKKIFATQEVSKKTKRGKHTTTDHQLIEIFKGFIIDTPGFLKVNILPEEYEKFQLANGYTSFESNSKTCKFRNCTHLSEQDCQIKNMVAETKISTLKYDVYKEIMSIDNKG